jgi:predicted RNA-binding Zn-ribbon protein involved in translation (DUF1610 family)
MQKVKVKPMPKAEFAATHQCVNCGKILKDKHATRPLGNDKWVCKECWQGYSMYIKKKEDYMSEENYVMANALVSATAGEYRYLEEVLAENNKAPYIDDLEEKEV